MLLGCAILLACATAAAAVAVLDEVHTLKDALSQNGALTTGGTLASAGWGDPQTLLLVGDDQRSLTGDFNTTAARCCRTRTRCCWCGSTRASRGSR